MKIINNDKLYNYPKTPLFAQIISIFLPIIASMLLLAVLLNVIGQAYIYPRMKVVVRPGVEAAFDDRIMNEEINSFNDLLSGRVSAFIEIAMLGLLIPLLLRNKRKYLPTAKLNNKKHALFAAAVTVPAIIWATLLLIPKSEITAATIGDDNLFWLVFCSVLVAPVFEEVVLRGFALNRALSVFHPYVAIIVSAMLFAVVHGNLVQGLWAFAGGILLGLLYVKYRSITICVIAHAVNNLRAVLTGFFQNPMQEGTGWQIGLLVVLSAVGISLFCVSKGAVLYSRKSDEAQIDFP